MIAEYRGSTAGRVWGGVLLLAVLGAASLTRESQAQVAPAQAVAAPLASSPASSTPASAPGPGDLKAAARPEAQDSATEYLQAVATDQRRKVDEIARRLQDFKEAHNLGSLDQRKDLIRESLKSANLEVQRAGVVLQMAETRVEQINDYRQRGTDLTGLSFIASQPLVAELRQQASQQRIAIAKLRETFRQSHPNMISATNALDQTQRELERAVNEICAQVEGERQAAFTASQRRTAELDRLKAASLELDRVAMQYLQIEREFLAQNQILQAILVRAGERESGVVLASRASAAPAAAEPVAAKAPVTAEPLSVVFQRKPSGWVLTETRGDQGELAKSADQIQVLKATLEASPPRTSGPSPAAPASDEFTVSVLGAVNAQGAVTLRETPRPLVLDALARAGGFAPNADRAAVRLIRLAEDGSRSTSILAEDALMSGNSFVQRGDVVIVPELVAPVPLFATVMGAVNKPGRIELPPGRKLTIVDLIASAGGPTRLGDLRKVRLTRLDQKTNGGMTMIIDVDSLIRSGQIRGEDVVIDAGDKIFVAERIL